MAVNSFAIKTLFPLFYMPKDEPVFTDYMWLQCNNRVLSVKKEPVNHDSLPITNSENLCDATIFEKGLEPNQKGLEPNQKGLEPNQKVKKGYSTLLSCVSDSRILCVNEEMQERHKISSFFGESKQNRLLLKSAAVSRISQKEIDELMSDIITVDVRTLHGKGDREQGMNSCFGRVFTNLAICIAYSQYYSKTIVLVNHSRKTRVTFGSTKDKDISDDNKTVFVHFDPVKNEFTPVTGNVESYWEMDSWRRPLKPISHYKMDDLTTIMYSIVTVTGSVDDVVKKKKKNELYAILENWCYGLSTI